MSDFPWFPFGHHIPGGTVGPLQKEDIGYQIVATQSADKALLIVESGSVLSNSIERCSVEGFGKFAFNGRSYLSREFALEDRPVVLREWSKIMGLPTSPDITSLTKAIRALRKTYPEADVGRSLFFPRFDECLPTAETHGAQD